ncbi:MAG: glycosyltransferase family 4 protein [Euryarchaeota archaeon]|jgi:glycosyltransferase involved in cell wall biosynthesis|nr:glycosyltransferase family 4 protein [Euryarchaeota archaeon]
MKIVHFSWEYPPVIHGGLGTFATEISKKQVELDHDVTVFTLNQQNMLPTSDQINGVDVYRPKTLDMSKPFYLCADHELRSWGPYFSFFADVLSYNIMSTSKLVNELVRKNGRTFDIIDAHDWLGIMAGMVAKKELNIPLIFHVHSTEVGRSIGRGSHTIKDIEYEGGQIADCVITVSNAMADELLKLGFPQEKIRPCWNGVDPAKYDPARVSNEDRLALRRSYGVQDHETLLFFIGRLVPVKGIDKLVRALPLVLKDFPNTKLLILGIGDMEHELRSIADELGIHDKVIMRAEFVSEEERIRHYAAADVVVLPSLYEPFGIVCTEALSMAKPTVVGARGTNGMREQVIPSGEKQCGIHVNPFEPKDIAWGVIQVLQSQDKGLQWGQNGRQRVLDEFSWDAVTKRTVAIYKEFLR